MTPAELDTMRDIAALFYAAGRGDGFEAARAEILCLPPRVPDHPRTLGDLPARHLTVVP